MASQRLKDDLAIVDALTGLDVLCTALDLKTPAAKTFVRHALANARLFDRKQQDYGPHNINKFGTFGVVVRMTDKFERLRTIITHKGRKRTAVNEAVEDTLRDVCNYAIIATLIERNEWPTT